MIARSWSAQATAEGARAYVAFFEGTLVAELERIDGHRGALVLTREIDGGARVEISVVTFWESMEAVARFAGAALDRAVVEDEARAVLVSFEECVSHRHVAVDTVRRAREG